jgi:hypothetical protein
MQVRRLAALALAGLLSGAGSVAVASAAQAAPAGYPPAAPAITLSANVVAPGSSVTVTGTGFAPVTSVALTWTGPGSSGSARAVAPFGTRGLTADATGTVSSSIVFMTAGTQTVSLNGTAADGSPVSLSATVDVRAAGVTGPGSSSSGGLPVLEYAGALLLVVLLGLLALWVVRHRRSTPAPAAPAPAAQQPVSR